MKLFHTPMSRQLLGAVLATTLVMVAAPSYANAIFSFSQTGGTVVMTSSGTLDTTKLVSLGGVFGWGGTGTENNGVGEVDIMGGTSFGGITKNFGFNAGTDASAITNPGGPFAFSDFSVASISGSKSFTTYSGIFGGFRQAGIGLVASDIVGGFWTPDQIWTYAPGATFASLGLNVGDYLVTDSVTGESIDIQIGQRSIDVPEPLTLSLFSAGLAGAVAMRRRKKKA